MRLVACDLDGTIVRPDGTVSRRTLDALAACRGDGVHVVFATGRPVRWMAPITAATGRLGEAICGNGAVVYDLETERVVRTRALTCDDVLDVVAILRALFEDAAFAVETLLGFRRETGYLPLHPGAAAVPVGSMLELLDDRPAVLKVLCRSTSRTADAMLAAARPALAGLAEPVHSGVDAAMLEVSALGVTKASTLALLAAERGIDRRDVVAFGDMPNDVPMLRWAGCGYAMADGHPEALAAADRVAPACADDGVAQVLEALLGDHVHC